MGIFGAQGAKLALELRFAQQRVARVGEVVGFGAVFCDIGISRNVRSLDIRRFVGDFNICRGVGGIGLSRSDGDTQGAQRHQGA